MQEVVRSLSLPLAKVRLQEPAEARGLRVCRASGLGVWRGLEMLVPFGMGSSRVVETDYGWNLVSCAKP